MELHNHNVIETSNLGFAYGERKILNDVSLSVTNGEIVGLVGPNGSGKSTILKIIAGIAGKYTGSVKVRDSEILNIQRKEMARMIAMVPQESVFSFPFSVLEVVLMGRHPHIDGLTFESEKDLAVARQALERCGAIDLAQRTIHELSSGERQRVVFARALAQESQILLLDEPASFLDIRHQVELYDIVRELASKQNCSIFTAIHDLNIAAEYCDRIYLLSGGEIMAEGNTADVLTYANLKKVFDTEVYIDLNSITGKPLVTPLSKNALDQYYRKQGL